MIPILLIIFKAIYGSSSSYIAELLLTFEPGRSLKPLDGGRSFKVKVP